MTRKPRQRGKDRYIEGFLAGQVVAYCERVNTGSGLAAQLACPKIYVDKLIHLVAREGCKSLVQPQEHDRVALWIYRDELVKRLIDHLESASTSEPSEFDIWSMGKLFGYADRDVVTFIEHSR
jgi:hypothetical protein